MSDLGKLLKRASLEDPESLAALTRELIRRGYDRIPVDEVSIILESKLKFYAYRHSVTGTIHFFEFAFDEIPRDPENRPLYGEFSFCKGSHGYEGSVQVPATELKGKKICSTCLKSAMRRVRDLQLRLV